MEPASRDPIIDFLRHKWARAISWLSESALGSVMGRILRAPGNAAYVDVLAYNTSARPATT